VYIWDQIKETDVVLLDDLEKENSEDTNNLDDDNDEDEIEFPPKSGASHQEYNKLFHQLFPDVPGRESLIWFFTCAIGDNIWTAKMGRLFVSKNHLCFCSLQTRSLQIISIQNIVRLEKLFPWSIVIHINKGEQVVLRRIKHRNSYYNIIDKIWKSSRLLFGIPLVELVLRENRPSLLPLIIEQTITALSAIRCLQAEGIFRVSPPSTELDQLQNSLQLGENVDFQKITNPHVTAGVLKLFLRSLPEPLLSYCLYPSFLSVLDIPDLEGQVQQLKHLLGLLPEANRNVVNCLCEFLGRVDEHSSHNKMKLSNLQITFAPLFLHSSDPDFDHVLLENLVVQDLVGLIILNAGAIFDNRCGARLLRL